MEHTRLPDLRCGQATACLCTGSGRDVSGNVGRPTRMDKATTIIV